MRNRMFFLFLLIIADITIVTSLPGVDKETHLDCTNDYETHMFCEFTAEHCSEYNVTLSSEFEKGVNPNIPEQCHSNSSQCCSSFKMTLVIGEQHTVEVWRGGQRVESKIIYVKESIKPKVPTILSVDQVHRSFQVKWNNNMQGALATTLTAEVTYRKKGDNEAVSHLVQPTDTGELCLYNIPGGNLTPNTTYVVTVKSYTDRSSKFSDSSKEFEFSTPASRFAFDGLALILGLSLSIAAVLIATSAFICFVKVRRTWDNCPNPKLRIISPYGEEILKPQPPITSSVSVEPLIPDDNKSWSKGSLTVCSSGIGSGSSGLSSSSYAHTEAPDIKARVHDALSKTFPGISPVSAPTSNLLNISTQAGGLCSAPCTPGRVKAVEVNSGCSDFENISYSLVIPNLPHQIMMDSSEVQKPAGMVCESAYHPVEGNMVTCPDQRAPACLLLNLSWSGSSLMATDMSYQQCNADSGQLSHEDDTSVFSISSDTDATTSCDLGPTVRAGNESFHKWALGMTEPNEKREVALTRDDSDVPACLQSFPPVDDAYQPFKF